MRSRVSSASTAAGPHRRSSRNADRVGPVHGRSASIATADIASSEAAGITCPSRALDANARRIPSGVASSGAGGEVPRRNRSNTEAVTCSTWRACSNTERISPSTAGSPGSSAKPIAAAIDGCCSARSRSEPRPVSRCSALRTRVRNSSAPSTERRSASRRMPASSSGRPIAVRSHPSAWTSRSPPTPSLSSGSSRDDTEPNRSRRASRSATRRCANARGSPRTGASTAERTSSHPGADPARSRPSSIAVVASSRSAAISTQTSAVRTA